MSDTMVSIRVSHSERASIREAAARCGESVSAFVRRVSLRAAGVRKAESYDLTQPTHTTTIGPRIRFDEIRGVFVQEPRLW